MKIRLFPILFFYFLFSALFFTCKKKHELRIAAKDCKVIKVNSLGSNEYSQYDYNNGRISKIIKYSVNADDPNKKFNVTDIKTIIYKSDSIYIENRRSGGNSPDTSVTFEAKIKLGANGFAEELNSYEYGNQYIVYDTGSYEYNVDGYLIHEIHKFTYKDLNNSFLRNETSEYTYEIDNGNITKVNASFIPNALYTINYEYYTERENKSNVVLDVWGNPIIRYDFNGKQSKNLMKSVNVTGVNDYPPIDYSYEYDDNGFVTKILYSYPNGCCSAPTVDLSYFCE